MTPPLEVTRLLQNPLGQVAPEDADGDIVRVSDGLATIYLTPKEYAQADEATIRRLLADAPRKRPL
jgi:ribosomal protein L9